MRITLNEQPVNLTPGQTLFALRDQIKPGADVLVVNGAPCRTDTILSEGDAVVLIRRGEIPEADELEALMAARHTPGVHSRLKRSCAGIAGLGGLGSAIAIALARLGAGRLILADFDVVEPSNLNRQQYFVDQIGMLKTEALSENLKRVNPYVVVETHAVRLTPENVGAIFGAVDVLIEAFDTPEAKTMLVESFSSARPNTPIVMATGLAGFESSNTIRTRRLAANLVVVGDLETAARPGVGLMAPRVGVAAHHQANAALRILMGKNAEGDATA